MHFGQAALWSCGMNRRVNSQFENLEKSGKFDKIPRSSAEVQKNSNKSVSEKALLKLNSEIAVARKLVCFTDIRHCCLKCK